MRKPTKAPPTDEQIMSYANVPVDVAGRYIGWNPATIYRALRKQRAPFGTAVENEETKTWSYHISPGALVNSARTTPGIQVGRPRKNYGFRGRRNSVGKNTWSEYGNRHCSSGLTPWVPHRHIIPAPGDKP